MLYLIAGHSNTDPGAVANGVKEADLNRALRDEIAAIAIRRGAAVRIDDDRHRLAEVIANIHTTERDVICDIHFNAAAPTATGIEVIVPARPTEQEKQLAGKIAKRGSEIMGIRNRGVKDETQSARGRLAIMRPAGINLLLEICFITNSADLAAYQKNKRAMAEMIATYLVEAESLN